MFMSKIYFDMLYLFNLCLKKANDNANSIKQN